jgi:hypothetical protein
MTIHDIINAEDGELFELVEPDCPEDAPAYEKWKGLVVWKFTGVIVKEPSGTPYSKGDLLNLSGMAIQSKWRKL